ncbi:uncharacterized protein LTR77_002572 [Saxophila tyrrhenica]|uniref:Uncharacterized protein n=1 Tax=Saxophila tyrrhenica TaxID=1690608 RepID=A0AAV9PNN9_9PEZI|nr:hypothetical protein LTR77_002572 [Saxophila tyrrhenica]
MDAQHTFLNPTTCFTVACVAFSILALSAVWKNQPSPDTKVNHDPPRPKPVRRRAVDSIYVAESPLRHIVQHDDGEKPPPAQHLSTLVRLCSDVAQGLRSSDLVSTGDRLTTATLLSELANLTTNLCRLQQQLAGLEDGKNTAVSACLDTTLLGLHETLLFARGIADHSGPHKDELLTAVLQQLRDQRPPLAFLLEHADGKTTFPPTPPCDADMIVSLKRQSSSGSSLLPPPVPTGLTPAMDTKAWIEPPPEYSPPSASSNIILQDSKLDQKIPSPPDSLDANISATASELHAAITTNSLSTLQQLLATPSLDPNIPLDPHLRTPLHLAAHLNHSTLIPPLIRAGTLISAQDVAGDTPLHLAAWSGHLESLSALLAHADAEQVDPLSGRDGTTPLFCAVTAAQIDCARLLLRRGARVSMRSESNGMGLLHQAAVMAQGAMVELLLERGAPVDARDDEGNTPLLSAAAAGSVACVQALLRAGADMEARQAQGLGAAHWAAHKGHTEVMGVLIAAGCDVEARAEEGATVLCLAANRGHEGVVRLLLKEGVDVRGRGVWDGIEGTAGEMGRGKGFARVARLIEGRGRG